jgi:hypothetical protein
MRTLIEAQREYHLAYAGACRAHANKYDVGTMNEELLVTQALLAGASFTQEMNYSKTAEGYRLRLGNADCGWWQSRRRAAIVAAFLFDLPIEGNNMTEEEGNYYIALATLHAPSTRDEICDDVVNPNAPFIRSAITDKWWVDREPMEVYSHDFPTRAEAARHYRLHYGLIKP